MRGRTKGLPSCFDTLLMRRLREGRGWSLRELARRVGVSNAYLCQLETGAAETPSFDAAVAIARAFEVNVNTFVRPPPRPPKERAMGEETLKQEEEWRPIPSFPGYEVSDHGRVRSWLKPGARRGTRADQPRAVATRTDRGYVKFIARVDGACATVFVHKAVLLAFRGPCPPGMESRHGDGRPSNNRLDNLSWGTKAENEADKLAHGTHVLGSRSMRRKLTSAQVATIRTRLATGDTFASLGREFGVTWQSIQAIARGKSWKNN